MHIPSAIVLANLLIAGLVNNSTNAEYRFEKLHQSDSVQQQLSAQHSNLEKDCPNDGQSPLPGCGRR